MESQYLIELDWDKSRTLLEAVRNVLDLNNYPTRISRFSNNLFSYFSENPVDDKTINKIHNIEGIAFKRT